MLQRHVLPRTDLNWQDQQRQLLLQSSHCTASWAIQTLKPSPSTSAFICCNIIGFQTKRAKLAKRALQGT
jgi:hypothetical protein